MQLLSCSAAAGSFDQAELEVSALSQLRLPAWSQSLALAAKMIVNMIYRGLVIAQDEPGALHRAIASSSLGQNVHHMKCSIAQLLTVDHNTKGLCHAQEGL